MNYALISVLALGGSVLYALVGVFTGRKLMRHQVAEGHNDVLVPIFLTAGVIYAVLLAFMVVAMWESYDAAKANTAEEASLLVPLYRQTMDFSPEKGAEMRELVRNYAEGVIDQWEHFRVTAQGSSSARMTVDRIIHLYGTMSPSTPIKGIVDQQFYTTFSQLMTDRNKRLLQAAEALSWVMWLAAIGGGVVTVGMCFVLYMDRALMHYVMTGTLAAMIGALLAIMFVLNKPFQGPLGITPEPFETSLALFKLIDDDFKQIDSEEAKGAGAAPAEAPAPAAPPAEEKPR
jgi:hypothetical protein